MMSGAGQDPRGDDADDLLLSRQLCFALHSTTLALGRIYQKVLSPLGLTYTQYLVMLVLWERRQVSVKELGEELILDSGTLTPLLKRLEQAGIVHRQRDAVDERRVLVAPTVEGWDLRARAVRVPRKILAACEGSGIVLDRLKSDLEALRGALVASGGQTA